MRRWFLLAIVLMICGCASPDQPDDRPDPRAPQSETQHGNEG